MPAAAQLDSPTATPGPTEAPRVDRIPFALWHSDRDAFAARFGGALRETGFAIVTGHSIPREAIAAVERGSKAFFALPDAAKRAYADADTHYQRGYSPFGQESAKGRTVADLKEFWHVGRGTIPGLPATPEVAEVEGFDAATRTLFDRMDALAVELMRAVAIYLGQGAHAFDDGLENGNSILRLLHYPPLPEAPKEGSERAAAHEDINLLTLLLGAEESGLQVLHRSGVWMPINAPDGAVVVNVGDMLQRLTAGWLPSTTHRVVNPSPERSRHSRYSMPFFFHLANDYLIDPLPDCVDRAEAEGRAAEPAITAGDFLAERLREIGLAKSDAS